MPTTSTTLRVATPFFLIALWISTGLVQGQSPNEPFQAMTKTIKWMEKLEHFDFEVTATTHNKSVSLVNPKNSSSTEGPYSATDREWAFTWNSIDEPDVEKMSVVACKEICKEFTSDIDGALGR